MFKLDVCTNFVVIKKLQGKNGILSKAEAKEKGGGGGVVCETHSEELLSAVKKFSQNYNRHQRPTW